MKELGVTDYRYLGGFGTYRDSGMKWHEDGHAVAADPVDGGVHENISAMPTSPRRPTTSSR